MKKKKILSFIICVFGPLVCGIIVGLLIDTKAYSSFTKPPFSPPAIVFPIVWSILYLLMGISLYIIYKTFTNKESISKFIYQLIVNLIWPILFFNFKLYLISVLWLILLIYLVVNMIVNFYSIKKIAGYLQFPYFLWLLIALYLNIGVAILN